MESQQIVDYIRQQLAAGHTEARLRQHLLLNGWSQPQVTDAFNAYHRATVAPAKVKKKRSISSLRSRRKRIKASSWTLGKRLSVAGAFVFVVGGFFGVRMIMGNVNTPPVPASRVVRYTSQQKQAIDVNTVGSTISQYSVENGELPTGVSISSDGNLVLCGAVCNPLTAEVSSLMTYVPHDVKLVTYADGVTVPNQQAMYIVPAASCANKGRTIQPSNAPKAMVILYAVPKGSTLEQHCVIL